MHKLLALAATAALATSAHADGGLSFIIDGDTFSQPFAITNTSTAGETVVGFGLDLTGTGYVFDTVTGGVPNTSVGVAFAPVGGTGAATGLVGPVTVADGASSFSLVFTDFQVGETFNWDIDVDPLDDDQSATVFGNQFIGANAYVDFSNGLRALGVLAAVAGNPDASAFTVRAVVPTPQVPEPATWAMMIGGFGMVGAAMRRRQTVRFA